MEEKIVTSSNVESLLPDFIRDDSGNFPALLKYYYETLERSSYPLDVIYNITDYFDLDTYTPEKLTSRTTLIKNTEKTDDEIVVSSTSGFPERKGSLLIDNEIIYYEYKTSSPKIKFLPNLSLNRVKSRFIVLDDITSLFNNTTNLFDLKLLSKKVFVPSANHILIKVQDFYLKPGVDYKTSKEDSSVPAGTVQFTESPSQSTDQNPNQCEIVFLQGFVTEEVKLLDSFNISGNPKTLNLKYGGVDYFPITDAYILVFKNSVLLNLNEDYSLTDSRIILINNLVESDDIFILSIESQVPNIGSGAKAYSIIENGQLESIVVEDYGSGYTVDETPKAQIYSSEGDGATAYPLVDGIKQILVVEPGYGYDKNNPPYLSYNLSGIGNIQTNVIIENESISEVVVVYSGSNIEDNLKISVIDPKMPVFGVVTIEPTIISEDASPSGYVITGVEILDGGFGLTNGPELYIDAPPFGDDKLVDRPQTAIIKPIVENGQVVDVDIINTGLGFDPENPPRVKSIDYRNAEVLDVRIIDGSITGISLLSGGHGYLESPTVYIVDNRYNAEGVYIGGTGAKARAILFNGSLTDIVIEDFGSGYSPEFPPTIFISSPKKAQLVAQVGNGEITGFEIIESGSGYEKSAFKEVSRGFCGLYGFDDNDNVLYNCTEPECHVKNSIVSNQYAEYLKYFLRRIKNQFLPEFPEINFEVYDIRNLVKKIKKFYSTKGTKGSVESFFYTVFDDIISVSYPKDQIMKSSDALWSTDTIMRVELISGDINNILGNKIYQKSSNVDENVVYSESIVDYITTLQTSKKTIYELVLDTNTYIGEFKISYTTKLSESTTREDKTITVDSTVGWPESNGYFYINNELITYKSKSLNQFFECSRAVNNISRSAIGGTKVSTNFYIYYNEGQSDEVILKVLGVSKTESTVVNDPASNYIEGDILNLSDLGTDSTKNITGRNSPLLNSWIYNVKKIQNIVSIELKQKAGKYVGEVILEKNHSLLRGQEIEIFGASPSVYNGSFVVENISSSNLKTFDYQLNIDEQEFDNLISTYPSSTGDAYLSLPLEKGKSDFRAIERIADQFTANVQNVYVDENYIYVASSGIPSYKIGENGGSIGFKGNALLPGNQRYLKRFPKFTEVVSEKIETQNGQLGLLLNGVPIYNYKSKKTISYGAISKVNIVNPGQNYDVEFDPQINVYKNVKTISGTIRVKNPDGVLLKPIVNGSLIEVVVLNGGSGYTEPPILTISGGGGTNAFVTAVLSGGRISRVVVDDPGSGYFEKPVINIVGGGGAGAVLDPIVRGPIVDVKIINGGQGFEESPELEVATGSGARAQAIVLNGRVRSIGLLSAGSGYTTPPLVVIVDRKGGKNALARAILYTSGPNKGSIERIQILNNGVGYSQNTVRIDIVSVGSGAELTSEIFQWTFDLNYQLKDNLDPKDGYVFVGNNNQFGSEYGHSQNPRYLRYLLGDNVLYNENTDVVSELQINQVSRHSPIIGWAYDGNPVYGPYGFTNPSTNPGTTNISIIPMKSGWKLKTSRDNGPSIEDYPLGSFTQDYEYSLTEGVTLDRYNGRFCKTPEFPDGVYAYFVTITGETASIAEFPYIIGNEYYAVPDNYNLSPDSIQSNLPKNVIRYRVPFESTDIDVVRKLSDVNSSLSTEDNSFNLILEDSQEIIGYDENGDPIYKTYEGYDINDDTFITDDEISPIEFIEESDIEIYDYFPTTDLDASVDIRVSNVNKFETSVLEGLTIENGGENYKVGDVLVFDTTQSGGNTPSASVSSVQGKDITELTFISENKKSYGKMITLTDHGLTYNERFKVLTSPESESGYQSFPYQVKVVNGIENVEVISYGFGYDPQIPVEFRYFNDVSDVELNAIVSNNGVLNFIDITRSGNVGLNTTNVNISIDPPVSIKATDFYITKIKNDRTGILDLPVGTLGNLEMGQLISNDIIIDANELLEVTATNTTGTNYKVTFVTVDQNLVQVNKQIFVTGFSNYSILNGLKTITEVTGNSFSFVVNYPAGLPSEIEVSSKDWDQISSSKSGAHTLAIKQDNSLWSWGKNEFGQLGIGNRSRKKVPVKITSDEWSSISANGNKSFAIKTDGTLWSWGQNSFGELGINQTVPFVTSPTQVGSDDTWIKISTGIGHSLAIKSDGTLWSWGRNNHGQLGVGSTTNYSYPVQVGTNTNWVNVSAGNSISSALNDDGELFVWGDSRNSCLGLGQLATVTILNPGRSGTFVEDQQLTFELSGVSGKVVSWNPTSRRLVLKNVTYTVTDGVDILPSFREKVYDGNDPETSLNYGRVRTFALHKSFDFGSYLEFILSSGSGVFVPGETITSSRGVTATVVSYDTATKKMQISNRTGEFILNDVITGNTSGAKHTFRRYTPQSGTRILVPSKINSSTWDYVSSSNRSTFAIKSDGTLWAWGDNFYGNLGTGDLLDRSTPTQIGSDTTWIYISTGSAHNLAIQEDSGTKYLYAWGRSSSYELGNGSLLTQDSPVEITTISDVSTVEAGNSCSFIIKDESGLDAPLIVFGNSSLGRLGNNKTYGLVSTPTEIQSVSVTLNPNSIIVESTIDEIDSTSNKIKVSNILNSSLDYPNDSEYSDNDIIEIVKESEEILIKQKIEQTLTNPIPPFSQSIKLNDLNDVEIGKLIKLTVLEREFEGNINSVNDILTIQSVPSTVEIYSGNIVKITVNSVDRQFLATGVIKNINNTFNVSLDVSVSDYETQFGGTLDQAVNVTILEYPLYEEEVIVITDIDEQTDSVIIKNFGGSLKRTLNPITLSTDSVKIEIYSLTTSSDGFDLYNSTFFIQNDFSDGQPLKYLASNSTLPIGGLTSGDTYYIKNATRYSFQLSQEADDVEAITILSIPLTDHKLRSIIRKRVTNSTYYQNKINYTCSSIDRNENLYVFGHTLDSNLSKSIVFHKYNSFGDLKYINYVNIPEIDRGEGITTETFDMKVVDCEIVNNSLYIVVESVYRVVLNEFVKDIILVKYDISADQPLKLSSSVILSGGSYELNAVGLIVQNEYINIIANVQNYSGSENKSSVVLYKILEDQPTTINTLSFTSNNNSVKLQSSPSNSNTIFLSNDFYENQPIIYTSFLPIGGLESNSVYYVIDVDNEKFKLSETPDGDPVQLTSLGDSLPNAHTISPVLVPNYDIFLQRRISFDDGQPNSNNQINVVAKSFNLYQNSLKLSVESNDAIYIVDCDISDFSISFIKEVSGITTSTDNHIIRHNQFGEFYLVTYDKLIRFDNSGNLIKEITLDSYTSDFTVSKVFFDYFDNIIVVMNDDSGSNSEIVVNYFNYDLSYKKSQRISQANKDLVYEFSTLDFYNSLYIGISEEEDNYYSYIYRLDINLSDNTTHDVSLTNETDLELSDTQDSELTLNTDIIGRQATQFVNFSITDINLLFTDTSKVYSIFSQTGTLTTKRINPAGLKPTFNELLNKKFYIRKEGISKISPVIKYSISKDVNYPIGSLVDFIDNDDSNITYSGIVLDKDKGVLVATDFSSTDQSLVTNILDNSNVKLRNRNPIYNSKINNTFINNEKIESQITFATVDQGSTFVSGDTVEFLSGTPGNYTVRGQANVISYDESTKVIKLKNVFDEGLTSSVFARVTKTVAGEPTETAFATYVYASDWEWLDKFEFEIPAEYEGDYIFESDNITNGSIVSIKVLNGGVDYTVAPSVIVQNQTGVNGSGLIAIALLNDQGQVDRILVENGGAKFTKTPNILLLGGDGNGATAKVSRMRFTSEVYTVQILDRDQDLDLENNNTYDQILLGDSISQSTTGASGTVISKNRSLVKVRLANQNRFDTTNVTISGTRTEGPILLSNVELTKVSPCIFVSGESVSMSSVLDEYDPSYINTYYPALGLTNQKINISRLYGVGKVNLISRLFEFVKQIDEFDLIVEEKLYIKTSKDHNLLSGSLSELNIDEYYSQINTVDEILSENEFIMKFFDIDFENMPHQVFDSSSKLFYKSPSFNMTYGHTYRFDVSDSSNEGVILNFSRDDTNRVTYTFNNVFRSNVPAGLVGAFVDFIVDEEAGQLSYYFNASSLENSNNFVLNDSSISLRETPYNGTFRVFRVLNDTQLLFELPYEPECDAYVDSASTNTASYVSYSPTSSGSISEISIFNNGGYFKVLPTLSDILCPRKIEKVEILNGGTEYEPGIYRDIPILGDGTGGLVDIIVTPETIENELEEEIITGRITNVEIVNVGENYTQAFIDINTIPGILGSAFNGSGASLNVVIPAAGIGHSLLPFSSKVGSIRKLSSLNIGFDYTHDYTLKPQIKFPISVQLINAKIISEIVITNPGFGYTSNPIVLIEGGGGTGASAVATVKNNRVSSIDIVSSGSGYFSVPNIIIQSKILYVVNLDLNLLQFRVPHGIPNGATIKLRADVVDGDVTKLLPLINYPGGMQNLIDDENSVSGSYQTTLSLAAIVGESNGLLPNQIRLAINENEALLNNYLTFSTAGSSSQNILTEVFGAKATATLKLSEFLGDETIVQVEPQTINGITKEVITASGRVLPNFGWISGPNILRLRISDGDFKENTKVIGVTSKSSGVINKIISASGFGEIGSTSKIEGKFYEETGKLSSISQKLQSTYYQNFAYLLKTNTPTQDWRNLVLDNLHPSGFALFSEYSYSTVNKLPRVKAFSSFSRNISVDVAQSRLGKLFSPAYVEDILNLNEISVVGKKLITSENIITSFVEKIDDISDKFDGETVTFDLKVNRLITNAEGETTETLDSVRNTENFLMIYLNNILQSRDSYSVQNGQITFTEPPQSRLVSKSRTLTLTSLYPPNGRFIQDEDLYVVRVKEFNIEGINIWQQNISFDSETDLNLQIGDRIIQGNLNGIIIEYSVNLENNIYTNNISVVFTTVNDTVFSNDFIIQINDEEYNIETVSEEFKSDLRQFKFDIRQGSEVVNEQVDIFSYQNIIIEGEYSINVSAYKVFNSLNELIAGNSISIRLYDFATNSYQLNGNNNVINLNNSPFILDVNSNLISTAGSNVDLSYDISESNISVTGILTFNDFNNYASENEIQVIPLVGTILESQLGKQTCKVTNVNTITKEVTVSIRSNINDPFFEENNLLQTVSTLGIISEGNDLNYVVFRNNADNVNYRVSRIRFKLLNDNTLTDQNTALDLSVDNTLLVSKTYGTINNTDSASLFVKVNDLIVGSTSRTTAKVVLVERIDDIDEVVISNGTKFDGYIHNRRNNPDNQNVTINDISKSFIIPEIQLENYGNLYYKNVESSRLLLDDYQYDQSIGNRFKSIQLEVEYGQSEEFEVDDVIEVIRVSADVEESAGRFKDARNLIILNKQEITDRSLAEIAIQHPDFSFPDDPVDYERFRYYDAYRLIQQNRTEIVDTAWTDMVTQYPDVASTETKCKRDIGYFVDAISLDVFTGGNAYSRKFTLQYFDTAGRPTSSLSGEEIESVAAFNAARDLMKQAVTNQLTIQDLTVIVDPITLSNIDPASCANVQSNIDVLVSIVTTSLNNGDIDSLPTENLGTFTTNGSICARDIGYIIEAVASDLFRGSNINVIDAANSYFDSNGNLIYIIGEDSETVTAFNKARDMMKLAINNQLYGKDFTVLADESVLSNNDPDGCANVQTTIDTLVEIITVTIVDADQNLLPTINPGRSFSPGEEVVISDGVTTYTSTVLSSDNVNYIVSLNNLYDNGILVDNTELLDFEGYTISTDRGENVIDLVAPVKDVDVTRTTVKSKSYDVTTKFTLESITGLSVGLTVTQDSTGIVGKLVEIIGNDIFVNHMSYDTLVHFENGQIKFNTVPVITKTVTTSTENREVVYFISTSDIIPQINKYQEEVGEIHSYTLWYDLSNSINNNTSFISEYAYQLVTTKFPYLLTRESITIGRCKTDISLIVDAISTDLRTGGTYNTVLATKFYFDSNNRVNFLKDEIEESTFAYSMVKELLILTSRNFEVTSTCNIGLGNNYVTLSDVSGLIRGMKFISTNISSSIYIKDVDVNENKVYLMDANLNDYFFSNSFTNENVTFNLESFLVNSQFTSELSPLLATPSTDVVNSEGLEQNILDLSNVLLNAINPSELRVYRDAVLEIKDSYENIIDDVYDQIKDEFSNLVIPNDQLGLCQRDMRIVSDAILNDIIFGGNAYTIEASEFYVSGGSLTYVESELVETAYSFFKLEIQYNQLITDSVNFTTNEKNSIKDRITELFQLLINKLTNNANGTYQDAAVQIAKNERFIVDEAFLTPSIPFLTVSEIDEIYNYGYSILKSIAKNILFGKNQYVVQSATSIPTTSTLYTNSSKNTFIREFLLTLIDLTKLSTVNFYINQDEDQYVIQNTTLTYSTDSSISVDPAGWPYCQSVQNAIDTFGEIIDDYWSDGTIASTSYVVFNYFPKKVYPEYYVQSPITSFISENDLVSLKSTFGYSAFIFDLQIGITKINSIEKRLTLTDIAEGFEVIKSSLITSAVNNPGLGEPGNVQTLVNVTDVNSSNSVNISFTGSGSNILAGGEFDQSNGFNATIESVDNIYILKNISGNFFKNNYIFRVDNQEIDSYVSKFEKNSATIVTSIDNRLILDTNSIVGQFTAYDYVYVDGTNYESTLIFSYSGFGFGKTTFDLTSTTQTGGVVDYFPPVEDGPIIVTIDGVLQEYGKDYSTTSDTITFSSAPSSEADFSGIYIGKWRKLDDISAQFDGITQNFGMRIDSLPYSISVFGNNQTILIDRNCLFTLNGVIQTPQESFTIDGSRIRFSNPPKPGTSFIGYIYVGSGLDVQSIEVIPQIEPEDIVKLSKEDTSRKVATVDSLTSLSTFEFAGERIGRTASADVTLRFGKIQNVSITSGGGGYVRRPKAFISSATGTQGNLTTQLGVSSIAVVNAGFGYLRPSVEIQSSTGQNFEGEILFESVDNDTQRISVIRVINSGFGYTSSDTVILNNCGNPSIPAELKILLNDNGGIENIYPVLVGVIEINEQIWNENLFEEYSPSFRIRGSVSKSEAVFISGGESESKIFVKEMSGTFVPGEDINIVSNENNVSLGTLTKVESFSFNIGGLGYDALRLSVTYADSGVIPPDGGFVTSLSDDIEYQFDTYAELGDSEAIIFIDKSYPYVELREFYVGEKIRFYNRQLGQKSGNQIFYTVESWNPTTLQLRVTKPTGILTKISLGENGSVDQIFVENKGDNYYTSHSYFVTILGQTESDYEEASFELFLGSVTDIKVAPYTLNQITYDGFGKDYVETDNIIIQPVDEFGSVENVVGGGSGCFAKLRVAERRSGEIDSITIPENLRGSQYATAPILITKGGSGFGVKSNVLLENNSVSGVEFISRGVGFDSIPQIIFAQKLNLTKEGKIRTYLNSRSNKISGLTQDVSEEDTEIFVESTGGFEGSGLIVVGKEVIEYTGKTDTSFTGCLRGLNFNYDQKLTLSSGFWDFSIGDVLPIIRNASEESTGISTNIRVYSYLQQTEDTIIPPFLFIKYVVDTLAFIDAGLASGTATPSFVGGVPSTALTGSKIVNSQSLQFNSVNDIFIGDIVSQTINETTVEGEIINIIRQRNKVIVAIENSTDEFASGIVKINLGEQNSKDRVITLSPTGGPAVERLPLYLFDIDKIDDGPSDTDLDLIKEKTFVICPSDDVVCNTDYPQLKGFKLLNANIDQTGFIITDTLYPRNLSTGSDLAYGYIPTKDFGPNNQGQAYNGVDNTNSDFEGQVSLDGGYPYSLYGVEEINELGNTIEILDGIRDANGNIATVIDVSAVNTGDIHESRMVIEVNKPTSFTNLNLGYVVIGEDSEFEGTIDSIEILTSTIKLTLVELKHSEDYSNFILDNQQGEEINIYNDSDQLISSNEYQIKSIEFKSVVLPQ